MFKIIKNIMIGFLCTTVFAKNVRHDTDTSLLKVPGTSRAVYDKSSSTSINPMAKPTEITTHKITELEDCPTPDGKPNLNVRFNVPNSKWFAMTKEDSNKVCRLYYADSKTQRIVGEASDCYDATTKGTSANPNLSTLLVKGSTLKNINFEKDAFYTFSAGMFTRANCKTNKENTTTHSPAETFPMSDENHMCNDSILGTTIGSPLTNEPKAMQITPPSNLSSEEALAAAQSIKKSFATEKAEAGPIEPSVPNENSKSKAAEEAGMGDMSP